MNSGRNWLILGGVLSIAASLVHLACLYFGESWFRFLGAPEPLVIAYENGAMDLFWMTLVIAAVLAIWAAYAFSGAGLIRRLPLLRIGLIVIAAIYLLRGLFLLPAIMLAPYPRHEFDIWSSAVVLVFGLAYAVGVWRSWPELAPQRESA